jgi:hypothetical protein
MAKSIVNSWLVAAAVSQGFQVSYAVWLWSMTLPRFVKFNNIADPMKNKDTAFFNVKYMVYPIYKSYGSVKTIFIIILK